MNRNVNRRDFLKTSASAAGALVIGFHLPLLGRRAQALAAESGGVPLMNALLRIDPDNTITMIVPSVEMGQGVHTSMPMLIAEELEIDWRQVRSEASPLGEQYKNLLYDLQSTGGSTSIRWSFDHLRQVGAKARELLRAAAAQTWNVPIAECKADNGHIVHGSGKKLSYGELAPVAAKLEAPKEVALKPKSAWKIIGTPATRLDIPQKVNGSARFGIDAQVDGMLIGTVKACPVFGGKLKAVDKAPALAVKGVKDVVTLDDAVIVVAGGYWPAKKGLDALKPEWDFGANAGNDSTKIDALLRQGLEKPGAVARNDGDAGKALDAAAKKLEAVYQAPLLAHATMEPMNTTAHVNADGVTLWTPQQFQGLIPDTVAKLTGVKPEQVKVNTMFLGGGFGRRFEMDFVIQAVLASKAVGAPVKLIWSREEDMRHDLYRPISLVKFQAGLDVQGNPNALTARVCCPSISARTFPEDIKNGIDPAAMEGIPETPYAVKNVMMDWVAQEVGVPVGYWRSVANSENAFFMEGFIDELAHAAGKNPLDFRLALLADKPRHQAVLRAAADAIGWGKVPQGHAQGIAIHESFGSIVAEAVEASVGADGALKLHKISGAVDCGTVVNPDTVKAQIESAIVYGLTAALFGQITIKDGAVEQGNFDTYPMLKLAHLPPVEVRIIESGAAIGGIGEPGTPPIAPALTNAIFVATSKRVRELPLIKQGFRMA